MKKIFAILIVVVLAAFALASFMFLASKAAPDVDIVFTKNVSNPTPQEGEIFTYTLFFNSLLTEVVNVKITDTNPAPAFLSIITDSVTGGADYEPSIDGITWEGTLFPAGTVPHTVTFEVLVASVPPIIPLSGYPITNTAYMVDAEDPGSLPLKVTSVTIYFAPRQNFLPIIFK